MKKWVLLLATITMTGCAMTRPPGVIGCVDFGSPLRKDLADLAALEANAASNVPAEHILRDHPVFRYLLRTFRADLKRAERLERQPSLNVLVLSGGGQWGAFGAGFLAGWSEAENPEVARSEIDIVTGISAGALLSSHAFLGSDWDQSLRAFFLGNEDPLTTKDVIDRKGAAYAAFSNALGDPRGRLEKHVQNAVDEVIDNVGKAPTHRKLVIGSVNLDDGEFWTFDMTRMARAGKRDCYAEALLASAALPILYPPRFMDGKMFVDGGLRFGTFLYFVDEAVLAVLKEQGQPSFRDVKIFVIVNGDLAVSAEAPVRNRVLPIGTRAAEILADQIGKDSLVHIEHEVARRNATKNGVKWSTRYVYVDDDHSECRKKYLAGTGKKNSSFVPEFMSCLYDDGLKLGQSWTWFSFDEVPARAIVRRKSD